MKICDKCRKELPPDYMQIQYPAFYIRKITEYSTITGEEINLCHSCSKAFEKWLSGSVYVCSYNKPCTYQEKGWSK